MVRQIPRKISVKPGQDEVDMVDALLDTGRSFKAVSMTEYIITQEQCDVLTKKKINFKLVPF